MRFDARHWNLIAGAAISALAGAGCGIPSSVPLALTIGGDESGEGEDGEGEGEDGTPECQSHSDCDYDERCSPSGTCYYYHYCDGPNSPERCQPPDDDWDGEGDGDGDGDGDCAPQYCGFGSDCDDGLPGCGLTPPVPPCAPNLEVNEIPVDVLPSGVLHFAEADGEPGEEAVLVTQESVWLLRPGEPASKLPRSIPSGPPESVEHVDLDGDGLDELLISDALGQTIVVPLNGEPEQAHALQGPVTVIDFEGDGSTHVATQGEGFGSVHRWNEGTLELVWELDTTQILGVYSPDWSTRQNLGAAGWSVNQGYMAIRGWGVADDVLGFQDLILEPYTTEVGAGLEITREGVRDLVIQASNGATTKIRLFSGHDVTIRGVIPGHYTRPLTHTIADEYPAVVSLGELGTAVTLVDGENGLLCHQVLPYFHSAAGGDFDHDGTTELLVQYPNGTVASIKLE